MEIQITNFLGIEQVAIPLGVPVAVTGPNASGKTSLATACAGILAQNDNPLGLGATKRPYMRDSADSGEVLLTDEHGTIYRHWRLMEKGIRVLPDSPDSLSKHVLGLTDFIGIPPKHRVEAWESCFLPAPKELVSMVSSELEKQISRSAVLDEVLGLLRLRKWTDCEAVFSHKAREAKQEWQRIAGETWGSKKADGWTPTGWRSDLDAVTPAECRTRIEEAREALRLVQTGQAVHESEIERARQVAVEIPSIVKELEGRTEARNDAKAAYDAINDEVRAIRDNGLAVKTNLERHDRTQPIREQTVSCPACGEALVVGPNGTLARVRDESAFESMDSAWRVGRKKLADELERLRAVAREIVGTRLNPAKKVLVTAEDRRSETASRLSAAKREAVTEGKRVITDDDQRRVAEAEQAVDEAKAAEQLVGQRVGAQNAHLNVVNYSAIAQTLGPKGIRNRAMRKQLDALDAALEDIRSICMWPRVRLDTSYSVIIADRAGGVSSESEQWRANFMLQAAIALVLGERHLIADGADILDEAGREQLIVLCDWLANRGVYPLLFATGSLGVLPESWATVEIIDGRSV